MSRSSGGGAPAVLLGEFIGSVDPRVCSGTVALVANTGYYYRFQVRKPIVVATAYFRVTIQAGNLIVGIRDEAGAQPLLASTGAFACPAASTTCSQVLTAPLLLLPGRFYRASIASDNTPTFSGIGGVAEPSVPGGGTKFSVTNQYATLAGTIDTTANNVNGVIGIWFA